MWLGVSLIYAGLLEMMIFLLGLHIVEFATLMSSGQEISGGLKLSPGSWVSFAFLKFFGKFPVDIKITHFSFQRDYFQSLHHTR